MKADADHHRPNILFAIADDASHFSAYGHRFVTTPAFDRVCAEGMRFNNAFTTNPKCAPSRASILTGRHTWQNGEACLHWNHWPQDLPVYPDLLMESGYRVAYTGKPWGPGDWRRSGRETNPAGPGYNDRTLEPPAGSAIRACDYAANFRDFLDTRESEAARVGEPAPFCFWYGGFEPHRRYEYGESRAAGKTPDLIDEVPSYWPDNERVRQDMLDYAYETEWFDRHLGAMLEELEQRGELDDTLVVVTSDNGAPFPRVKGQMYDHDFRLPCAAMWRGHITPELVIDDLVSFIDFAPTFLEAADVAVPTDLPGRSLFDLFAASRSGTVTTHRTRAYMGRERHDVGREGDLGYPVRCIRTPEYLYVRNAAPDRWPAGNPETGFTGCDSSPTKSAILELAESGIERYRDLAFGKRPPEELYAVRTDPHAMHSLAGDPAYADISASLARELTAELERTSDPRVTDPDFFEGREYLGKQDHSWASYEAGTWQPQSY